ncbi:tetratricopeptide repeat protein [Winogradskyella sp. A3E31]|uniref:tetratricopeptide repeat protein n=1 Tax=Winogradskyella sp. A3E31 TaxID=3349637 RepID=UPI00398B57EF
MKKKFLIVFTFAIGLLLSYAQTTELERKAMADALIIADGYFDNGEFEKALLSYKKLYEKQPYNYNYLVKLVSTFQQLENYEAAKQLLLSRIDKSRNPTLLIELGYNYQQQDSIEKAQPLYEEAIAYVDEKPNYIYTVGRRFEQHSLFQNAIKTYKKGKLLLPDKNFSIQLARLYADEGDIEQMFSNYLDHISYRPDFINNIKRAISDFISENKENENNLILRKLLLKRIQLQPDTYWYDMLSWLYVQEKAYNKSFIQEKALFKRNPESLNRIIQLALTAMKDEDNDTAVSIFNYLLETSQDLGIALTSHQYLLEIETEQADKNQLKAINDKYQSLFERYGRNDASISLQLAYAQFLAFHFNQPEQGSNFLKEMASIDKSPFQEGLVKMKLADILVLQEKFNEALIYYSQIQANLKNSTLAQEARFKIAKTSYYKGDFDWAESQLKILKSSTSQLIANDALDLKLLISDNKYEDSTQTALKYYAKADLLAFQNKTEEAIGLLGKILTEHKGESITPQALFKQAQLFETNKNFVGAESNYLTIIKDYREGILIDDAYFHLAELYNTYLGNPEEAKSLYEKIIFEHQDSIYFVEARKNFRMLRGDTIN